MKNNTLLKRIERKIDKEAFRTGKMGSEIISILIELTEKEKNLVITSNDPFINDSYFGQLKKASWKLFILSSKEPI